VRASELTNGRKLRALQVGEACCIWFCADLAKYIYWRHTFQNCVHVRNVNISSQQHFASTTAAIYLHWVHFTPVICLYWVYFTSKVWGLSVPAPRPRGRVGKLLRSHWCRGLEYMPKVDDDDGATRAPYICSSTSYTMETLTMSWVQLCTQQKLHDLKIVHWCCANLRLH